MIIGIHSKACAMGADFRSPNFYCIFKEIFHEADGSAPGVKKLTNIFV